jgi:hypothetical protein
MGYGFNFQSLGIPLDKAGVTDLSSYLKLDQTVPQTTTGIFQFDGVYLGSDQSTLWTGLDGTLQFSTVLGGAHTINIDLKNDPNWVTITSDVDLDFSTSNIKTSGYGQFGGSQSGMSTISAGMTVNNLGGGAATDDFIAKTDTIADAFVVDASADEIDINATTEIQTNKKLQFRDTGIYVSSQDDGHLDLDADVSIDFNQNPNFIFYEGDLVSYGEEAVYY